MGSFCSFLVLNPHHSKLLNSIETPSSWNLKLCPDPSGRFWFDGYVERSISHPEFLGSQRDDEAGGELLLVEGDKDLADNIINLICAVLVVIEGMPSERIGLRYGFEIPDDEQEKDSIFKNIFRTRGFFEQFLHHPELPIAIKMAANAWYNRSTIYAIHKLCKSFEEESITWWSAAPRYGEIFAKSSDLYRSHVGTATAINLAFSGIEELQLEIRSSAKNQRFLGKSCAEWNPEVLEDIEGRLRSSGIDPAGRVDWIVRGEETAAEAEIKPSLGAPTDYSDGQIVRDTELTIPEALHVCSYIRNKMTAHRLSDATPWLGPYEVHNAQSLLRRLILSKSGVWNVWTRDL